VRLILLLIPALPLIAVPLSFVPLGRRFAPAITIAATVASLGLTIWSVARVVTEQRLIGIAGWVELDGFGATMLLLITFVNAGGALFSWGYVAAHERRPRRIRSYCAHLNAFAFSLALVPVLAQPALVWIAIEFTAVFSVLLVAFENTDAALEAAWKYIALMFMGAAIALLGVFVLFWAQQVAGGGHYDWYGLRTIADRMPPVLVRTAFLLILVGFGVKVGFVPLHTWLPDAHSQAPAAVCALLSGVKTTNSLYVILRLVPLMAPGGVQVSMQIIGLISVGVAAFLLLQVRDYKRLFAYSTVEHMGIIFVAAGLGTPAGTYAAMLQIVSHSLTKSLCFFAAGAVLLVVGTREIPSVRGLIRTSPAAGVALLFGGLAIGGAPPFAVFFSEFSIFRAGLAQHAYVVTGVLAAFITVAFFGVMQHLTAMVFGGPADARVQPHPRVPVTCLLTLVLAAIPVIVLGVYQPEWLHTLLTLAASTLVPLPSS
jgi:hydrogenase-4 component F